MDNGRVYRETAQRRAQRMAEGCIVVEMEAAAEYRDVVMGQIVYGGDVVKPDGWDHRDWVRQTNARELLFWLAVEDCLSIRGEIP